MPRQFRPNLDEFPEATPDDLTNDDYVVPVFRQGFGDQYTRISSIRTVSDALSPALDPAIWANAIAHTTDALLTSEDADFAHTNEGATGAITLTLPNCSPGLRFVFARVAPYPMRILPQPGDSIGSGGAGKYIEMQSDGAILSIRCISANLWAYEYINGTYGFEPDYVLTVGGDRILLDGGGYLILTQSISFSTTIPQDLGGP